MISKRKRSPKTKIDEVSQNIRDPPVIFSTRDGDLFVSLQGQLKRLNYTASIYTDAGICRDAVFIIRGLRDSQVSTLLNRIEHSNTAFEIHRASKEHKPVGLIRGYNRGEIYFSA